MCLLNFFKSHKKPPARSNIPLKSERRSLTCLIIWEPHFHGQHCCKCFLFFTVISIRLTVTERSKHATVFKASINTFFIRNVPVTLMKLVSGVVISVLTFEVIFLRKALFMFEVLKCIVCLCLCLCVR